MGIARNVQSPRRMKRREARRAVRGGSHQPRQTRDRQRQQHHHAPPHAHTAAELLPRGSLGELDAEEQAARNVALVGQAVHDEDDLVQVTDYSPRNGMSRDAPVIRQLHGNALGLTRSFDLGNQRYASDESGIGRTDADGNLVGGRRGQLRGILLAPHPDGRTCRRFENQFECAGIAPLCALYDTHLSLRRSHVEHTVLAGVEDGCGRRRGQNRQERDKRRSADFRSVTAAWESVARATALSACGSNTRATGHRLKVGATDGTGYSLSHLRASTFRGWGTRYCLRRRRSSSIRRALIPAYFGS